MSIRFKTFTDSDRLVEAAAGLLREYMQLQSSGPFAVMLPGGRTPVPTYRQIERNPFTVSAGLHVMMSDERMAPESSSDNNFAGAAGMIKSLGIDKSRILKANTSLRLDKAASAYNRNLSLFFENKGRLVLALLGIGSDGHTASLFCNEDLEKSPGLFAIPVTGVKPCDRVSVTPGTISRAERIVFLAAGKEKEPVIARLKASPDSVIAGRVVKDSDNVELWHSA